MWKTSSTTMEILIMLTRLSVAASLSVFCTAACFSQLAFSDITVTAGTGGPTAKDDPVLHFGLDPHESVDIVIVFLDGSEAAATDVPANQTLVVEGSSIKHKKADRVPGT